MSVRVCIESGAGRDDMSFVDDQESVVVFAGVVVAAEGEGVFGAQPISEVGRGAFVCARTTSTPTCHHLTVVFAALFWYSDFAQHR